MTPKERWEAMTPRERDAWIVLNLGLESSWGEATRDDSLSLTTLEPQTYEQALDYCNDPKWKDRGVELIPVPNLSPSTNIHDDYLVLQKVRETWDADAKCSTFSYHLQRLMALKRYEGQLIAYAVNYEPGDYSHAAYLTLNPTSGE